MPSDTNDKSRRSGDHSHSSRRTHHPPTSSSSSLSQPATSSSRPPRSPSPSTPTSLPFDASPLTSEDYFIRSSEFKHWLSTTKQLYLDEISSASARRYFDRFVRRWNTGRLDDPYYSGTIRSLDSGAGTKTRHKWSFTTHQGYASEKAKLELMKDSIDTLTNGDSRGAREARDAERRTKRSHDTEDTDRADPARPSSAARQFDREHQQDLTRISSSQHRKRLRQDAADIAEEQEGSATGRERTMQKRREINADNRAFAESRRQDGLELDDRDIYDDDRKVTGEEARSKGRSKREQARLERMEERKEELQGRVDQMKRKEDKTMDMFRAMARERFGGGSG